MLLPMACILRLSGAPSVGHIIEQTLERTGHRLQVTSHVTDAFQILARESVDLIVADECLPGITGQEILDLLCQERQHVPLIVVSGTLALSDTPGADQASCAMLGESLASAAAAAGSVSHAYRTMVVRADQLESAVRQMLELARLDRENEALRREVAMYRSSRQFLGASDAAQQLLRMAGSVAAADVAVLVEGEPGTGKKLLAAIIHDLSHRREQPFVQLQCGALPEGLIESALFGHERGAVSGAIKREVGALERADGGSLLLEDVGTLRPALQARLLRAIETQRFERVGGTASIPMNVRLLATTERDLAPDVAAGTFLGALLARLCGAAIRIPPLRDRTDDIPALALHFAQRAAQESGREISGLAQETLALLQRHAWPGNVRELRATLERAVIVSQDAILQPQSLAAPADPTGSARTAHAAVHGDLIPRSSTESGTTHGQAGVVLETLSIDDAERALIKRALEVTGQNRTRAAALLGISVRTLRNKLNRPAGQSTTSSTQADA